MFTALSLFNKTVTAKDNSEKVNRFKQKDPAYQWSPISDVTLTKKNNFIGSQDHFVKINFIYCRIQILLVGMKNMKEVPSSKLVQYIFAKSS